MNPKRSEPCTFVHIDERKIYSYTIHSHIHNSNKNPIQIYTKKEKTFNILPRVFFFSIFSFWKKNSIANMLRVLNYVLK